MSMVARSLGGCRLPAGRNNNICRPRYSCHAVMYEDNILPKPHYSTQLLRGMGGGASLYCVRLSLVCSVPGSPALSQWGGLCLLTHLGLYVFMTELKTTSTIPLLYLSSSSTRSTLKLVAIALIHE